MINIDLITFKMRASKSSLLLTEPKVKSNLISETLKDYLIEYHIEKKYNIKKEFSNKYTEKGIYNESESLEMYNRLNFESYKNTSLVASNDHFTGHTDSDIINEIGIDLKSSYDIFTFHKSITSELSKAYFCQAQTYCDLFNAKKWKIVFCLTNTPDFIIEREKRYLLNKFDADNMQEEQIELYHKQCEELERKHNFDNIPLNEKVFEFVVEKDQKVIDQMKAKVDFIRTLKL